MVISQTFRDKSWEKEQDNMTEFNQFKHNSKPSSSHFLLYISLTLWCHPCINDSGFSVNMSKLQRKLLFHFHIISCLALLAKVCMLFILLFFWASVPTCMPNTLVLKDECNSHSSVELLLQARETHSGLGIRRLELIRVVFSSFFLSDCLQLSPSPFSPNFMTPRM